MNLEKPDESSQFFAETEPMALAADWDRFAATARPVGWTAFPGPVLALVPHADDETLGFGGLLAQWCAAGVPVEVVLVTDGVGSHPQAAGHDAAARRDVREAELRAALVALGAQDVKLRFWRKPDTQLAHLDAESREEAVEQISATLQRGQHRTILTPWRLDPHGDHRALTAWVLTHLQTLNPSARPLLAEYCVWLGHQGDVAAFAGTEQLDLVAVDVRAQRDRKRRALATHRSQLGQVFDDPDGFTIPASLAASVEREAEYFLLTQP